MTSPYYNDIDIPYEKNDMIMLREDNYVKSINDFDDPEIEYVINEQQDFVQLSKYNYTKEKGLLKEWRIFERSGRDVFDCMIADEIISTEGGVLLTLGDEFERYADEHCGSYSIHP